MSFEESREKGLGNLLARQMKLLSNIMWQSNY
jgi:hypothetical protein